MKSATTHAVSPLVHEPTDGCSNLHCYSHNVDEPGKGYIICLECGHLYRFRIQLWWALIRAMAPILWSDRPRRARVESFEIGVEANTTYELAIEFGFGPAPKLTWRSWAWSLICLPFRRPSRITFCQECSHDF